MPEVKPKPNYTLAKKVLQERRTEMATKYNAVLDLIQDVNEKEDYLSSSLTKSTPQILTSLEYLRDDLDLAIAGLGDAIAVVDHAASQ